MMQIPRRPMPALRRAKNPLPQDELAVPRQLLLPFLVHLLIGDAGPAHFILVIDQNLSYFFVEPVLDREFFEHPQADAVRHHRSSLGFDLPALDQPFYNLSGHVRYKIPYEKHLCAFPLDKCKRVSLLAAPTKCKEGSEMTQIFSPVGAELCPESRADPKECCLATRKPMQIRRTVPQQEQGYLPVR